MDGKNVVPIGTGRPEVKVWLDEISKTETHIYIAVFFGSENDKLAKAEAERVKNQEMLTLRHQGFEMPDGFKPETYDKVIDGTAWAVIKYVFQWSEWKRKVMGL